MMALYAACRALDDIVDDIPVGTPPDDPIVEEARRELARWRQAIDALHRGDTPAVGPIRALVPVHRRFGLDRTALNGLVEGMEMDLSGEMVAPTVRALEHYAWCVAGCVGLLSIRIFEADDADSFAIHAGEALQLTNILRDVMEDAERGRLYVPSEFIAQAGIPASWTPIDIVRDPRFGVACAELDRLAAEKYRQAYSAMPAKRAPLRPALMMAGTYLRLLQRMRRRGWRDHASLPRLSVPEWERFWVAARHLGPPMTWPGIGIRDS